MNYRKMSFTPLTEFEPENPQRGHKQDSTLKTHSQAMVQHLVPDQATVLKLVPG